MPGYAISLTLRSSCDLILEVICGDFISAILTSFNKILNRVYLDLFMERTNSFSKSKICWQGIKLLSYKSVHPDRMWLKHAAI